MDSILIILVVSALIIAGMLMLFINLTSTNKQKLDVETYRKVWQAIKRSSESDNLDAMQMSIVKADKLLDKAMCESNVKGSTMGERLRFRKGMWSNENAVWASHKLRNQIAHDDNISLNKQTVKRAMAGFERALTDLGAL